MIETLEIENYRGLRRLRVANFARLNLFAGRNNSGKTSLLEAIFLLAAGGDPAIPLNSNVVRLSEPEVASNPRSFRETIWKPLFYRLDTSTPIEIKAFHRRLGSISLQLSLETAKRIQLPFPEAGSRDSEVPSEQMLLCYRQGELQKESSCALGTSGAELTHHGTTPPFGAIIVLSHNGSIQGDAVQLGELRKQKRGDLICKALRVIEPRLQSIEDNSASGTPMIWGDVGLDELVPLPAMGDGMSRLARIVLGIARSAGGVALVDEIENGFHHAVLPDVWRVIGESADLFDTQVFATTHSFECVQAADAALEDQLTFHRLEAFNAGSRCVTYDRGNISAAIKHELEVR